MNENIYNSGNYIMEIWNGTDDKGVVSLPVFCYDRDPSESDETFTCQLHWKKPDAENLCKEVSTLLTYFHDFGKRFEELDNMEEEELEKTLSKEQYQVWITYRPLFMQEIFYDQYQDVEEKEEGIQLSQELLQKQASGETLSPEELSLMETYSKETVTDEDKSRVRQFQNIRDTECCLRIGQSPFAQGVVVGGTRICRLFSFRAPEILIENEVKQFIKALILHRYGGKVIQGTPYVSMKDSPNP